jgi:hypothetical protein
VLRSVLIIGLFLPLVLRAQVLPPAMLANERVDVTGDGIADLVIAGAAQHMDDPEMGKGGLHRCWLAPLPGTVFLTRCTPNASDYYRVEEGSVLSAAAVEAGLRFLQLCWTSPQDSVRIGLLYKGFGFQGVDTTSWYGSDDFEEGTLVVRSTTGRQAVLAAFTIDLDMIADTVGFTLKASVPVDAHFGEFEPLRSPTHVQDSLSTVFFGHEWEPQAIVPPGIPPDERLDLTSDDIPDVVLSGHIVYTDSSKQHGWYRRGVSPMPGTAFLMKRQGDGSYDWFWLKWGGTLTPAQLEMGLHSGSLRWADPAKESVLVLAIEQSFGLPPGGTDEQGWYVPEPHSDEQRLVYRTAAFGRPMLGALEIGTSTGGELWIQERGFVNAGEVLRTR